MAMSSRPRPTKCSRRSSARSPSGRAPVLQLRGEGPAFLLESAGHGRVGRYSFIGFRPQSVLRWSLADCGDPYALAAAQLQRFRAAPTPELPFAGGAVGVFAYDLVRTVEPLGAPNPDP